MLGRARFTSVVELGELETLPVDGATITGVPFFGEHSDLAASTKLGYVVRIGREQMIFPADSCKVEPRMYDHVRSAVGPVGTLFIGMECDGRR